MTVLLFVCTIVTFLTIDHFVQKARRAHAEAKASDTVMTPLGLPDGVRLALNHVWMKEEKGFAVIGVDEFLGRMLGAVEGVLLPAVGSAVTPASANIALCDGDRSVQLAVPLAGRIAEVNTRVLHNPAIAHRDPYGSGWLMKIVPEQRKASFSRFLSGPNAQDWLRGQVDLAKDFLTGVMPQAQLATLQDGGAPTDGVLKQCDASAWKEFERQFVTIPSCDQATK